MEKVDKAWNYVINPIIIVFIAQFTCFFYYNNYDVALVHMTTTPLNIYWNVQTLYLW